MKNQRHKIIKISIKKYKPQYAQYNGIYEVESYGTIYWVNGSVHREDGPACEYINGTKAWYINDKYHRLDGPAYESFNGCEEYYIEGKKYYTKKEFELAAYMYKNGLQDYL